MPVLDRVQSGVASFSQDPRVSKEPGGARLVAIHPSPRRPDDGRRCRLRHDSLTPKVLRSAAHAYIAGGATESQARLWRDMADGMHARWMRHTCEAASEVVAAYLGGGDFLKIAKWHKVSRRTAFYYVSRFFGACSFWHFEADARTECEQTHASGGGDGRTPAIGRREHSAGTCETCSLLAGATWDGWVMLPDDGAGV